MRCSAALGGRSPPRFSCRRTTLPEEASSRCHAAQMGPRRLAAESSGCRRRHEQSGIGDDAHPVEGEQLRSGLGHQLAQELVEISLSRSVTAIRRPRGAHGGLGRKDHRYNQQRRPAEAAPRQSTGRPAVVPTSRPLPLSHGTSSNVRSVVADPRPSRAAGAERPQELAGGGPQPSGSEGPRRERLPWARQMGQPSIASG